MSEFLCNSFQQDWQNGNFLKLRVYDDIKHKCIQWITNQHNNIGLGKKNKCFSQFSSCASMILQINSILSLLLIPRDFHFFPCVSDKIRLFTNVHIDDWFHGAGRVAFGLLPPIPRQKTFLFSTGLALTTSHLTGKSITCVVHTPQASSRTYQGLSD